MEGATQSRASAAADAAAVVPEITPAQASPAAEPAVSLRRSGSNSNRSGIFSNEAAAAAGVSQCSSEISNSSVASRGLVATLSHLLGISSAAKPEGQDDNELEDDDVEKQAVPGKALLQGLSRSSSGSLPMCLICLEPLQSADFMVTPPSLARCCCEAYGDLDVAQDANSLECLLCTETLFILQHERWYHLS